MSGARSSIVSKSVALLDLIAGERRPMTFSEIVERSGHPKSSAHRLLAILRDEALVEHDEQERTYRLGRRVLGWAHETWRNADLPRTADEEMERLSALTGRNLGLAVLDEERVLYLRTIDVVPVRYASRAGEHAPLHCTAVGKVIAAFLPARRRQDLLGRIRLQRFTEHTITDPARFRHELERVRVRGYATSVREEFFHVCGIAAPIFDHRSEAIGGLCMWSLVDDAGASDLEGRLADLRAAAMRISTRLGHVERGARGPRGEAPAAARSETAGERTR